MSAECNTYTFVVISNNRLLTNLSFFYIIFDLPFDW